MLSALRLKASDLCEFGFFADGRLPFAGTLSIIGRAVDARNGCVAIGADVVRLAIKSKRRIALVVPSVMRALTYEHSSVERGPSAIAHLVDRTN